MHIKEIKTDQKQQTVSQRPQSFKDFIGQEHIKSIMDTAIVSAQRRKKAIGHMLLAGPSGYGKTTLAHIVAHTMKQQCHVVTGYAINKPADIISILTAIQENDIIFIDEIHRLKPTIEEMLYIAMEDYAIDMVMPDGGNVRVPLQPFTLIGATTLPNSLSEPLINRFVYHFHLMDYQKKEKNKIVARYLHHYGIQYSPNELLDAIGQKVDSVPREIHNMVIKIRDFLASSTQKNIYMLNQETRLACEQRLQVKDGGITPIHQRYLSILEQYDRPVGLKTIALQL